ncbi:MAG: nitroreductase [Syntrophomonadaceae bacterium]|nr:nitroreductase [Syntrophomonadaceae bacterium]
MAIKTGRADKAALIILDRARCNNCGLCAEVCKGAPLYMEEGKLIIDESRWFGCIGCGHCMCICPQECITINGRDMSPDDMIPVPQKALQASYEQLYSLLLARRSIRVFQDRRVEAEIISKITEAVSTAPMGVPPSDVEILVFDTPAKVREFADDIIAMMKKSRWLFAPLVTKIMGLFAGKEYRESADTFINPALGIFLKEWEKGNDYLFYDAPLAMYFHLSLYADPADSLVAAAYAMLAAESLGLGTCMIGSPAYFIKYSKQIKQKYGLPLKNQPGIIVIFGYPRLKYRQALKRRLGKITYW